MNLWSMHLALPVQAWLPLGLALVAALIIVAVVLPVSRRRSRGIATILALRTITLLAAGFAVLTIVATFAVVHTGLHDLATRHSRDLSALASQFKHDGVDLAGADAAERLARFRLQDSEIAFAVAGTDRCAKSCVLSITDSRLDPDSLKTQMSRYWPSSERERGAITIDRRPYLLITTPIGSRAATVGAATTDAATARAASTGTATANPIISVAIDASYLADQAARTAWMLLAISYSLLLLVGWSTWRQVRRSLAARIHAINTQLLSGHADESHQRFDVDGHELQELAESVSAYIKRTLEEKSSSDERYRRLVELAPDAMLVCVDSKIRSANPAAIALAGAERRNNVLAASIDRFLKFDDQAADAPRTGTARPATWTRLDGTTRHVEVTEITDTIGGELVRQFIVRDVTHSHDREAALAHRAAHDSLTGLTNRGGFESRLCELLAPGGVGQLRDSSDVAVLFIDLDDFKPVNDTYGHAAGDQVLIAVAGRLKDATRGTDIIARLGGDEFGALVEVHDAGEADAVAERILRSLHQPFACDGATVSIRASIGIATTRPAPIGCRLGATDRDRAMTAAEMIKAADAAMYAAKSAGGDRFISDITPTHSPAIRTDVRFPALA